MGRPETESAAVSAESSLNSYLSELKGKLAGLKRDTVGALDLAFTSANESISRVSSNVESTISDLVSQLQEMQDQLDAFVYQLFGFGGAEANILEKGEFKRPWFQTSDYPEYEPEIRDYICDLIEEVFASQPALHEKPLTPAEIAGILAQNPKFEPLRAVYYGGKPISAEQFVRECMDWDCRPIPFDEEAVLVGRKPKKVDVLHERFFRFDGVNRDLYGWTGWSPEAQANIFLTLAEQAADKTPFYRWVARLISLPEEAPDVEDPEVREGLRGIIGDVEPYPYVVMG